MGLYRPSSLTKTFAVRRNTLDEVNNLWSDTLLKIDVCEDSFGERIFIGRKVPYCRAVNQFSQIVT